MKTVGAILLSGLVCLSTFATPTINIQPASQTLNAGDTLQLSIDASSTNSITYQWKKGTNDIASATNATLVISNVVRGAAGQYTVELNDGDALLSDPADVTIAADPFITAQPVGGNSPGAAYIRVSVAAAGTPIPGFATGLHYQWYRQVPGSTNFVLLQGRTNAAINTTNAGQYYCVITNRFLAGETIVPGANILTSSVVTVTTYAPPQVVTAPANLNRIAGRTAAFSVAMNPHGPLTFQWNYNGTAIPGANNSSYTILDVQQINAGTYTCSVTNPLGIGITTSTNRGHLNVTADGTPPTSVITAPGNNAVLTNGLIRAYGSLILTNPDVAIVGRAVDNGLVTNVHLTRTFPSWAPAIDVDVTIGGLIPGRKPWTNIVTLVDGTNTFVATASDSAGFTNASLPRNIFLHTPAPLTVTVSGHGKTVPAGSTFYGAARNGALLAVNRGYSIQALATSNGVTFLNWMDGQSNIIGNAATLNFIMTNGLILHANFNQ